MKKLFGRSNTAAATAKKDGPGPLTNKTVQVGQHTVLVEHVLGLGGYGEIYRAVDISSGQRFALKVGSAERSGEAGRGLKVDDLGCIKADGRGHRWLCVHTTYSIQPNTCHVCIRTS